MFFKTSYRKLASKKRDSTGDKLKDMMKDLAKTNLDLENEIIRKKKQENKQKEETNKLKDKVDGLKRKLSRSALDSDDDTEDIESELRRKQDKLRDLKDSIRELKMKSMRTKERSMSRANRIVEEIGDAIDNIDVPKRSMANKPISRTHLYNEAIIEEEKIPLDSRIEGIFHFTMKETKRVKSEREKAELEYRLISGLKNNLHKENIDLKQHLSSNLYGTRKGIIDIYNRMENQSNALESEKRNLSNKIDK